MTANALYYRHSGQFSAARLFVAILASLATAIVLGAIYAYIDLYSPLIYINFLATLGLGFAVGWAAGRLLQRGQVRNDRITFATAILVAVLALYSSWVFWIYGLIQKATSTTAPFNPAKLAFRPDVLWRIIVGVNEVGVWGIGHVGSSSRPGGAVHGEWLWAVWLIEAAAILWVSIATIVKMGTSLPYCETCRKWCPPRKRLFSTPPGDQAMLKERLESKDFSYLISLGPDTKPLPSKWLEVYLHSCDTCQGLQALTVNSVWFETTRKGQQRKKERPIVNKLLLSEKERQTLIALKDQYVARSTAAPAAPAQDAQMIEETAPTTTEATGQQ